MSATGPLSAQIVRAIHALLSGDNTWGGSNMFTDIVFPSAGFTPSTTAHTLYTPDGTSLYWNGSALGGGGGSGTVTTVSVVTANGVSGTVANATTTPAITLSLGAITPSSVNALTLASAAVGFTIAGGTSSKTATIAGNFTTSGGHDLTLTTSGSTNVTFPTTGTLTTNAGTVTLSNKRITKRVGSTTSSATPTINTDNVDEYALTAQAVAITSMTTNLSGTPSDGDELIIRITGTGSQSITWGAGFASGDVTLPAATTGTKTLVVAFKIIGAVSSTVWQCMASTNVGA